jgi:hypothetical protein
VRERRGREMLVPLPHPAGHVQADFGEATVIIGGVERKAHFFGRYYTLRTQKQSVAGTAPLRHKLNKLSTHSGYDLGRQRLRQGGRDEN